MKNKLTKVLAKCTFTYLKVIPDIKIIIIRLTIGCVLYKRGCAHMDNFSKVNANFHRTINWVISPYNFNLLTITVTISVKNVSPEGFILILVF